MAVCVSCAENHKTCNTNVDVSQVINRIHSDPEKYASEVNDLQDGEIKNKLLAYIEHVSSGKSHPL